MQEGKERFRDPESGLRPVPQG